MTALIILALGLANWFGTLLVVESEFFRPLRAWLEDRYANAERRFANWFWWKINYMINCQMCAGFWVALFLAPFAPALFPFFWGAGFIVTALVIKAIGHLILVLHKYGEEKTNLAKSETAKHTREASQFTYTSGYQPPR
jgi:hypothetical protein